MSRGTAAGLARGAAFAAVGIAFPFVVHAAWIVNIGVLTLMYAALAMGAIEAVVAVEISPTWAAFSFFVVLIAFLLVRPQGIFGLRERTL